MHEKYLLNASYTCNNDSDQPEHSEKSCCYWHSFCSWTIQAPAEVLKIFMLNSAENEIFPAHKC